MNGPATGSGLGPGGCARRPRARLSPRPHPAPQLSGGSPSPTPRRTAVSGRGISAFVSWMALGAMLVSGIWRPSTAAIWYLEYVFRLFPSFVAAPYNHPHPAAIRVRGSWHPSGRTHARPRPPGRHVPGPLLVGRVKTATYCGADRDGFGIPWGPQSLQVALHVSRETLRATAGAQGPPLECTRDQPLLARGRGPGRLRTMSAMASIRKGPSPACATWWHSQ